MFENVYFYYFPTVPIAAPQGLYCDAHNSTAMLVTWELVEDTRETMKGKVWGYQVGLASNKE